MKVVSPSQMNKIDQYAINTLGIPSIVLMENAALKVIQEISKDLKNIQGKHILIFAGKGNNGGDALAVARHLANKGAKLHIYLLARKQDVSADTKVNLSILEHMDLCIEEITEESQLVDIENTLPQAQLIIDGIFGTGLKGDVMNPINKVFELINAATAPVLSIDIPSGISGADGKVLGTCIQASKTVTFGLPKLGLVVHPGCEFTGELVVVDISIPSQAIEPMNIEINLSCRGHVETLIPQRMANSNKGTYGKVYIISGSQGMTGSGCLAAKGALRVGAGLVYLAVPATLCPIYDTLLMESVTLPLADNAQGSLSKDSIEKIFQILGTASVLAFGPGISVTHDTVHITRHMIEHAEIPLVIDADGLNAIAKDITMLEKLKTKAVITPHPGEMSRLTGKSIAEIQMNRVEIAKDFASKWGIITVLKGARTVVAHPNGTIFINPTGNPGMSTGGTGDVLTGMIAGLIGQGSDPMDSAVAGVYLHGLAGDIAASKKGCHSIIASDIIEELPFVMKEFSSAQHCTQRL